jgi:HEAT repeat protein
MRRLLLVWLLVLAGCARPAPPVRTVVGPLPPEVKPTGVAEVEPKADNKPASYWIAALQDKDEKARGAVAVTLGDLGAEAVPVLVVALKNSDAEVRGQAARILEDIARTTGQPQAVAALRGALKDQNVKVRESAAGALGYAIGDTKNAVPALLEAIRDPSDGVRARAAWALGHLGPDAKDAAGPLSDLLRDKNDEVCHNAFEALGHLGAAARASVPLLLEVVKERGKAILRDPTVVDAVGNIGPAVTPVLLEVLKNADEGLREIALENLGDALAVPEEAPPEVLAEIDKQAKAVLPAATAALKDDKARVRQKAAELLGKLGSRAKDAAGALKEAQSDKDEGVQKKAAEALKKIESGKE